MLKPNMPNVPGMGAMTDTLEYVKNLWGGMGIPGTGIPGTGAAGMSMPGMVMPTLSVEEIRKKISDLKAVESWLELNMNMLRGTIQALEVQAATIATLQSMGEAMTASMNAGAGSAAARSNGKHKTSQSGASAKPSEASNKAASAPEPTSKDEADAAQLTAPLVNAAAWWNALQDQFRQAVTNAMAAEAGNGSAKESNGSARNGTANGTDAGAEKPKARSEAEAPPRKRKPAK